MAKFSMDAGWLPFHPSPKKPLFRLPDGAVDAHCHVFGPGDQFPFSDERKYTPCDASIEQLWALRDHLGFSRNVIVQATCHGTDNCALIDALERSQGLARGVASINPDISDTELERFHNVGIRGVRFNFVKRLVDVLPFEKLSKIAERISRWGWHIVIYFEAADLKEYYDFFTSLPTQLVVDHMGRPDVSKPVENHEFELFLKFMADNKNIWSKVTCPERLSKTGPDTYEDVTPFARKVVNSFPDRVLWGTDWPHPNMKSHMPDDGHLVDFISGIATTSELQHKLLVDNPMKLYWPEISG